MQKKKKKKKSNFEKFESTLYMKSLSMPLIEICIAEQTNKQTKTNSNKILLFRDRTVDMMSTMA